MTLAEKLDYFSMPEPNSGCHLWLGTVVHRGYGMMHHARQYALAHRWAWISANGPIPAGMVICHKCDLTACINPAHLFVGTASDNMRDMVRKGRGVGFTPETARRAQQLSVVIPPK